MKSYVLFILMLAVASDARKVNYGQKILSELQTSMSSPSEKFERYSSQVYPTYHIPGELKYWNGEQELSAAKAPLESSDHIQQFYKKYYKDFKVAESKSVSTKGTQKKNQKQPEIAYYFNGKPYYYDQKSNVNSNWQENFEQHQNLKSDGQKENKAQEELTSDRTYSNENQEQIYLHEQLQQQWNRILNHNRAQLKALSSISEQNNTSVNVKEKDTPAAEEQTSEIDVQQMSGIEKEIEYILKHAKGFGIASTGDATEKEIKYQRPPIVIHREISVTKHHPVTIVKKVKVPVAKPILVPVPEPYHVKVPHPYSVPVEIVKQIPVPVVRHY